ncbi:tRNA(Ile)-lysidine synthetase [Nonlabens tegetincola]|uniref:tRNA(Ile)-lysidine synthase n=1 Tax=Nonlabens tegetincola TaxID=323273 RepID=A0A090Q1Z0_9FLAO|nr:tRNA lysidine(34) synthetase TilS [Nonlabens tegetincola]GAK97005.1 tRNA(Ile)-lysidine synthetase [Nonlabens tegetincola]
MLQDFKQHIQTEFPELLNASLLIAVSGGCDSMVLWDLIHRSGLNYGVTHCNFLLRDNESDKDQELVVNKAQELGVVCHTTSFNTQEFMKQQNMAVQEAARKLRYDYFYAMCREFNYDYILTAHHLDDQIETFFMHLNRGAGLNGLTGIPDRNNKIRRPLLIFSRERIENYATKNQVEYREDASNNQNNYLRNQLRNLVLPQLYKTLPQLRENLPKVLVNLKASKQLQDDAVSRFRESVITQVQDEIHFSVKALKFYHQAGLYLYEVVNQYTAVNYDELMQFMNSPSGKRLELGAYQLWRDREYFKLIPAPKKLEFDVSMPIGNSKVETEIGTFELEIRSVNNPLELVKNEASKNNLFLDAELIVAPLKITNWKAGDKLQPFGMNGKSQLVSDILTNYKVSTFEKPNVPVLRYLGHLLWVIGYRNSIHFPVTSSTKKLLKITFHS